MIRNISDERILAMTDQERRLFNNIKKAFYDSDCAFEEKRLEDRGLAELLKAIDTAKKLRLSLMDEDVSNRQNRQKFIDFLYLEIPAAQEFDLILMDASTGEKRTFTFGEILYQIRCMMMHENETLNVAEGIKFPILLDWKMKDTNTLGDFYETDGKIVCNAYSLWCRLRQVLAKFITIIDGVFSIAANKGSHAAIFPPLKSIKPE